MSDSGEFPRPASPPPNTVSISTVRWGVGVAVTLLLFLATSLWSASSTAASRASELKVLEARVNGVTNAITNITSSVAQISDSVSSMRADQAAFQAEFRANLVNLKEDLRRVQRTAPPPAD